MLVPSYGERNKQHPGHGTLDTLYSILLGKGPDLKTLQRSSHHGRHLIPLKLLLPPLQRANELPRFQGLCEQMPTVSNTQHKCILLQFWRSYIENQGTGRVGGVSRL